MSAHPRGLDLNPDNIDLVEQHTEQPSPVPNDRPSIQAAVRRDLIARERLGVERYGTPLQPHNGRDALRDAYEEALDLACYLRQALIERDGSSDAASPSWQVPFAQLAIVRTVSPTFGQWRCSVGSRRDDDCRYDHNADSPDLARDAAVAHLIHHHGIYPAGAQAVGS
jgi:hypothetical protein